jgi:hypothetical protein
MISDRTLSISTVTHIINAPLEKVDIADWLFNLPDANINAARMYTSQQAILLVMMDIPCQSMLR